MKYLSILMASQNKQDEPRAEDEQSSRGTPSNAADSKKKWYSGGRGK